MLKNPSNPLLKASEAAPAKPVEKPAANEPAATPDTPADDSEKENDGEEEEEEEPEQPEVTPEPPAAPKQKLSAFDRGALRLVGKGDLIARVERAETEAADLTAQVSRLSAENARLTAELASHKQETPKKIEAAAKGRENEVSRGVAAELSALGITKEAAPAAIGADATPEGLLEQYKLLTGSARTEFLRANKTKLLAAEAAVSKSKN